MTIATSRFGAVEVSTSQIIHLPTGVLGFPDHKHFAFLPHKPDSPFLWLQSVEDPELAFIVMNPQLVMPDYAVHLAKEDQRDLHLKGEEPLVIYGMVTIPRANPAEMTINLLGPLVINEETGVGKQVIMTGSDYSHRHPVLRSESESSQKKAGSSQRAAGSGHATESG
jgi:flagellar assembly factor FliW